MGNHPLPSKLKGTTLIEVLTSMALLGVLFVMGMMLLGKLTDIHSPVQRYQNRVLVLEMLNAPIALPFEKEIEQEIKGRRIIRTIEPFDLQRNLYEVAVTCLWQDQVQLSKKRIVILE